MGFVKNIIYKNVGAEYDLIMYGVSSVINTRAVLAGVYSTLSESQMKKFTILGDDIYVELQNVPANSYLLGFKDNPLPCTKVIITNPNVYIGGQCFRNHQFIESFETTSNILGATSFYGCTSLKVSDCIIPNITSIGSSTFYNNIGGGTLNLPSVTSFSAYAINQSLTVGGFSIDAPECLSIGAYGLHSASGTMNFPKLNNLGDPATNTFALYGIVSGSILNVNNVLATNNAGNEDADIAYARGRGATIIFTP